MLKKWGLNHLKAQIQNINISIVLFIGLQRKITLKLTFKIVFTAAESCSVFTLLSLAAMNMHTDSIKQEDLIIILFLLS